LVILTLLNLVVSLTPPVVLVTAITYLAVHHQRLFLALFMLVTALESTRDFAPHLEMQFMGFTIYVEDLTVVVASIAILNRIGQIRLHWVTRTAAMVLGALVLSGVVTWVATYGVQIGVNSWRPQILTLVLLIYATTRPRTWSWNDLRVIIVATAIVVAVASVAGVLTHGLGSSSSVVEIGGVIEGGRPVSASGALLMLVGLWVAALSTGKWTGGRVVVVLLLGTMVLLTQHRTVWVAAIFGVVAWWLAPKISAGRASGGLSGPSRTILMLFIGTATALVGISVAALGQSARNDETLLWRVARWAESMTIPRSWIEWLVGSALGPTPASTPSLFDTSAHSLYISTVEMTGFIGLAAILLLVIAVGRTNMPLSGGPLGLMICLTFLGFGITYQLPPWAWMLAGILLASTRIRLASTERALTHTEEPRLEPLEVGPRPSVARVLG
jgi:hypothetical protein